MMVLYGVVYVSRDVNTLAPGKFGSDFESVISHHHILQIAFMATLCGDKGMPDDHMHLLISRHWFRQCLAPSSKKQLPEPMLAKTCVTIHV